MNHYFLSGLFNKWLLSLLKIKIKGGKMSPQKKKEIKKKHVKILAESKASKKKTRVDKACDPTKKTVDPCTISCTDSCKPYCKDNCKSDCKDSCKVTCMDICKNTVQVPHTNPPVEPCQSVLSPGCPAYQKT